MAKKNTTTGVWSRCVSRGNLWLSSFDQHLTFVVHSASLPALPTGANPTTFGVSKSFPILIPSPPSISKNEFFCMQEDGNGDIFVGTGGSQLYYITGTNVAPQPTRSPTIFPTSPTMSPTTFSPISVGVTCPPSYQRTQVLSIGFLTLQYSIVRENAPHDGTAFTTPTLQRANYATYK